MTLAEQLIAQQPQLARLIELLERERELLGAGQIDGASLGALAIDKQRVLTALDDLQHQRRREHAEADDETAARAEGCLAAWQQVHAQASTAARLNRFNGGLIAMRSAGNQQILNALHNIAGQNLYGPDGLSRGGDARIASRA